MKKKSSVVVIVGLGYVGLPLALLADRKGYSVVGIDNNLSRINSINRRVPPFPDEKISKDIKKTSLKATDDFGVVADASIIVICVPTPVYENYMPNLRPVEMACRGIARHLRKGQLVILESTVNPGVCEEIIVPLLEKETGLRAGIDFHLAHCPERINPGDKKWHVGNISRVVGSLEKVGLKKAVNFYSSIISAPVKPMNSIKEAEAVKVVENSFRDINIAFVNELAQSFSHLGIDVVNVIEGASTKPFAFMPHFPGCGVGGHCIPVDPYYLIEYAKQNGFNHRFLSLAREINNSMPRFTVDTLIKKLKEKGLPCKGTKVALLGLSYKANTGDDRESPSYKIIEVLKEKGIKVSCYDPYIKEKSTSSLDEALSSAKAVVIATDHDEFGILTPKSFKKHGIEILIDGRNCLNKESFINFGIVYQGIGR